MGGTHRHTLNTVCAVAVMGWGRVCGRWKVSRHRPAGRLLTTDLKQRRAREVCSEASPQCAPAASLLPVRPQIQIPQQRVPGGGVTPRGDSEVEPPWVDPPQCKPEISPPEQPLPLSVAQLVKDAALNPQWGLQASLHLFSPPRLQVLKYLGDCSSSSQLTQRRSQPSGHWPSFLLIVHLG